MLFNHGDRVVVRARLDDHHRLQVNALRHQHRVPGKVGTVLKAATGHPAGDAWWVRHDDGKFATYWSVELDALEAVPQFQPRRKEAAVPLADPEPRRSWHTGKLTAHHPVTGESMPVESVDVVRPGEYTAVTTKGEKK